MLLHRTSSAPQITQQKCISLEPHSCRSSSAVFDNKKAMMYREMSHHGSHSFWLPKHLFFFFFLPAKKSVSMAPRVALPAGSQNSQDVFMLLASLS